MADFDLTQTDQQVQNILNDGQSAMGAGAQTTLTTEYVMLKDTSGVYHKILKSSFTEAIRDVLAGLLVNNDKGTTINQIAAIASGDFGSITPANLASVLGAVGVPTRIVQDDSVTDMNNLLGVKEHSYIHFIAVTNAPSNLPDTFTSGTRFFVQVLNVSDFYIEQMLYDNGSRIYLRSGRGSDGAGSSINWSSWKEL